MWSTDPYLSASAVLYFTWGATQMFSLYFLPLVVVQTVSYNYSVINVVAYSTVLHLHMLTVAWSRTYDAHLFPLDQSDAEPWYDSLCKVYGKSTHCHVHKSVDLSCLSIVLHVTVTGIHDPSRDRIQPWTVVCLSRKPLQRCALAAHTHTLTAVPIGRLRWDGKINLLQNLWPNQSLLDYFAIR